MSADLPPIGSRVLTECRDCGHIHRTGDEGLRCDAAQGRDVAALLRSFGVPVANWPKWVTRHGLHAGRLRLPRVLRP